MLPSVDAVNRYSKLVVWSSNTSNATGGEAKNASGHVRVQCGIEMSTSSFDSSSDLLMSSPPAPADSAESD